MHSADYQKQGDIVEDVNTVMPFVQKDKDIFPVQLEEIQEQQEVDRSLRKRIRDNPKDYNKIIIENH